jgi:hypothetical protein
MEEIIPNKGMLKHYKVIITKYQATSAAGSGSSISRGESKIDESTSLERGKKKFISAVHKVIDETAKTKLREKHVVKLCGTYPRIGKESVLELTERFKRLKKIMVAEEDLIQEELEGNPSADVMAIMDQLDEQLAEMRGIIADAEFLITLHEQLKNTRSKYAASKFRLTVQFLLELGSLAGSITEAVYVNLGTSSAVAKLTGVSLYVINIVFSWVNTGFSRVEEIDAKTLQNLTRIQSQSLFARDVGSLVERTRREREVGVLAHSLKREDLESGMELMDRPPHIGSPASPLQAKINALYEDAVARKGQKDAGSCLSVDDLLVPVRKPSKSLSPQRVASRIASQPSCPQPQAISAVCIPMGAGVGLHRSVADDKRHVVEVAVTVHEVVVDVRLDADGRSYPVMDDVLFA